MYESDFADKLSQLQSLNLGLSINSIFSFILFMKFKDGSNKTKFN